MSEQDRDREARAERLMARLSGFIQGLRISITDARDIVDRVIASEPSAQDEDLLSKARTWMLIALG